MIMREVSKRTAQERRKADVAVTSAAIGARVESLRLAKGWTTAELARRSGLSACWLRHLQHGSAPSLPQGYTLAALADALGATMDWIWRGADR